MKTLTLLFSAIIISTAVFAQKAADPSPAKGQSPKETQMKDGIMNKDGKIWYIKSLTGDMSLENGVTANQDGTVKLANGKTLSLNDGDCINFQGQMVGMNQKNTTVDGLVVRRNGIMWVWSILDKPLLLKNGTYANSDGTIRQKDGKYTKIKDKEFVDLDGNITMMTK